MPTLIRYWGSDFKGPREARRIAAYFSAALASGWRCVLVCSRAPDDAAWAAPVTDAGIAIEHLPRARGNFDRHCVQRTWRLCRRVGADVFHCDNTHTSPLIGAWLARVPVRLWTKHAMEPAFEEVRAPSLRDRLAPSLTLSIRLATRVLPISRAIERELVGLGAPPRRLVMLPLPLAADDGTRVDRAAARAAFGCSPGDVVVGTVGRSVPVKGWDVLLRAMVEISAAVPATKLLLAGSTGRSDERAPYERLVQFLAEHGLADRVRFTGHVTDIAPVLSASDIFVLPSRSEGYSLALLEALCAGLPVVSTRVGIAPDVITDGENGVLVDRDDPPALARGLMALAADPELRRRCARPPGTPIPGIPTAEEHAHALLALYETLLRRR
ncbi:MAG: glycosyltransferase family 4 protein [Acidobacteriota bacterium]